MKTDFFDPVAGDLHGDTLASYLFIICLDCILLASIDLLKENDFARKTARSRRYLADITESDFAEDLAFLANTPAQIKSLLHRLKQAALYIVLLINANKIECTCFRREVAIPSLSGKPRKLVAKFTYFTNNILSTENDVNIHLVKA